MMFNKILIQKRGIAIALLILIIITINIISLVRSKKIHDVPISITKEMVERLIEDAQKEGGSNGRNNIAEIQHKIIENDTISSILTRYQASSYDAHEIAQSIRKAGIKLKLEIGKLITIKFAETAEAHSGNKRSVEKFTISGMKNGIIEVAKEENGKFKAKFIAVKINKALRKISTTITTSFYTDSIKAGADSSAVNSAAKLLNYVIDFQRDVKQGSNLYLAYEVEESEDGNTIKVGEIVYAALEVMPNKKKAIYRYKDKDGKTEYVDSAGAAISKGLIKTPLSAPINGARISSGFGLRKHPVHGYSKMHKGIDFAAPRGTPIYAAADGAIEFIKRSGAGYGRHIKIKHNSTYATLYAHMDHFAKGIKQGTSVKAGQVIGYVGCTGTSTGNHLHYEVHRNGKQINPANSDFSSMKTVTKKIDPSLFKKQKSEIEKLFASS